MLFYLSPVQPHGLSLSVGANPTTMHLAVIDQQNYFRRLTYSLDGGDIHLGSYMISLPARHGIQKYCPHGKYMPRPQILRTKACYINTDILPAW